MEHERILTADWDDIVFENRNKEYGAYWLRKKYSKHINTALAITIGATLLLFSIPYIKQLIDKNTEQQKEATTVDLTKLAAPPPLDATKPPPPPPNMPPPPPKTIKFTPPVVKPDEEVKEEDEVVAIDSMKTVDPGPITNVDPNANIDFDVPSDPVVDPGPQKPLMFVEKMPSFPGGENALISYLAKNIRYPSVARENNIEGIVPVQFVVQSDGSITDVKALRDIGGGCAEEAVRIIKTMPKWAPGNNNGVNVPVILVQPVHFQLTAN